MPEQPVLSLTLPSDLAWLPVVRRFIETVCECGGLDSKTTGAIVLAANEAVSNVIRHAHRNQPQAVVQVHCRLIPHGIEVSLVDQGDPFDVARVPHLDPSDQREGGRGVFLMRALLDELICCPHASGGNLLRMVKRTPDDPDSSVSP